MYTTFGDYYRNGHDCVASLALSETQPELIEPLALADVKSYLKVDFTDDDLLIGTFISAAREQAEYLQGRVLVQKSFELTVNGPSYDSFTLTAPTVSVDSVLITATDGTLTVLGSTAYHVNLAQQPATLWLLPSSLPSYTCARTTVVQFTAGYAATDPFWSHQGARLKAGMLLLISLWYTNRLPSAMNITAANEYPFAVTHCLSAGALRRAR